MVTYKTVYYLRHPKTGVLRYIGATSTSLARRLAGHLAMSVHGTSRCAIWIRSLRAQGLRPEIIRLIGPTEYWAFHERRFIEDRRAEGKNLLNMADGGPGGASGCRPSSETRAKRSTTLKTRYANDPIQMTARQELARKAARSANGRASASARMTAIWADPERAAAMRKCMRGVKKTVR